MKKVYLFAVVFALLAGFATYFFANELEKKSTIKDKETVNVIVALQDIPKDTKIDKTMFAVENNPMFAVKEVVVDYALKEEEGRISDPKEMLPDPNSEDPARQVEMITLEPIYAGEQVCSKHLAPISSDQVSLSFKLAKGKKAYSFGASAVSGVDGYIALGDTVDVIVNERDDEGKLTPKVAYKNLKIIRVSNATDYNSASASGATITNYSTLTVEVTEEQALQLYEIENTYSYKLVLNPRGK